MSTVSSLRQVTEDDVATVVAQGSASFPITDPAVAARLIGKLLGGPVITDDIIEALDEFYVGLPIKDAAALLKIYNRIIDVRFGEDDD